MNIRKSLSGLAVLALSMTALVAAHAAPVTVTPVALGVAVSKTGVISGTNVASNTASFTTAGGAKGTLTSEVYSGDTSNIYHGYTFVYTLADTKNSFLGTGATVLSLFGFGNANPKYLTQVEAISSGTTFSSTIGASRASGITGDLDFNFGPALGAGVTSGKQVQLVVYTNALGYVSNKSALVNVVNGGYNSFQPSGAVAPEPASLAVFGFIGLGLLGLGLRARRNSSASQTA